MYKTQLRDIPEHRRRIVEDGESETFQNVRETGGWQITIKCVPNKCKLTYFFSFKGILKFGVASFEIKS